MIKSKHSYDGASQHYPSTAATPGIGSLGSEGLSVEMSAGKSAAPLSVGNDVVEFRPSSGITKKKYLVGVALDILGIPHESGAFRCPNRRAHNNDDAKPSAGFYADGTRWKCHGCGQGGDAIDLIRMATGCGYKTAVRKLEKGLPIGRRDWSTDLRREPGYQAQPKKLDYPVLDTGTKQDLDSLSKTREWHEPYSTLLVNQGILRFGHYAGQRVYTIPDASKKSVELRRVDGEPFASGEKSHAVTGSSKGIPLGLATGNPQLDRRSIVMLCEGIPDMISAHILLMMARRLDILPCAVLGSRVRLAQEALQLIGRREVLIWAQPDDDGIKAAETWSSQLAAWGTCAKTVIPYRDGDINDWMRTNPTPGQILAALPLGKGGF